MKIFLTSIILVIFIILLMVVFYLLKKKEGYQPKKVPFKPTPIQQDWIDNLKMAVEIIDQVPEDVAISLILPYISSLRELVELMYQKLSKTRPIIDKYIKKILKFPSIDILKDRNTLWIRTDFTNIREPGFNPLLPMLPVDQLTQISFDILKGIIEIAKPKPNFLKIIENNKPSEEYPNWIIFNITNTNYFNNYAKFLEKIEQGNDDILIYITKNDDNTVYIKIWINPNPEDEILTSKLTNFLTERITLFENLRYTNFILPYQGFYNPNNKMYIFNLKLKELGRDIGYQEYSEFVTKEKRDMEEVDETEEKEEKEYDPPSLEQIDRFVNNLKNISENTFNEFYNIQDRIKLADEKEDNWEKRKRYLQAFRDSLNVNLPIYEQEQFRSRVKKGIELNPKIFPSDILEIYTNYLKNRD